MHICLVHYEYPQETSVGGIGTYQKNLAKLLRKYGHDVTVIAGAVYENQDYIEDGIRIVRIKKGKDPYDTVRNCIEYRKRIAYVIKKINENHKIDIVEVPDLGAEGIVLQKDNGRTIPIIVKLHTPTTIITEFNGNSTTFSSDVQKQLADWEYYFMVNADKLVSCSDLMTKLIKNRFPKLKDKVIETIYNVVDLYDFFPKKENHESNIILYCGSLEQRKGLLTLARAIPIVIESLKNENIEFDFVGTDYYRNDKHILTSDYILSLVPNMYHRNIKFLNQMRKNNLNDIYNEARIGLIPSLFDNLPYVALEELSTELPLILSNNTGICEIIKNSDSGLFYDPLDYKKLADRIIYLYRNPRQAKSLRDKWKKSCNGETFR